jgi:hypothetical protein
MSVLQKAVFAKNYLRRFRDRARAIADNSFFDKDLQSHCDDAGKIPILRLCVTYACRTYAVWMGPSAIRRLLPKRMKGCSEMPLFETRNEVKRQLMPRAFAE